MHVLARKVCACIVVFFLNTASSFRAPREVGTEEKQTDRFRATGGVKYTLSKLVTTGITIFPGNTVSRFLYSAYCSFQTSERIRIKIFALILVAYNP